MKAEFPGSIDGSVRFIDRYTVWDALCTVALVLAGWAVARPLGPFVGAALGVVLAEVTPNGERIDKKVVDELRYVLSSPKVVCPKLSKMGDGSAVFDDGYVMGVVEVSSCDIEHLPEPDKRANRDVVAELLSGLDYRFEIHSRQRHVDLSECNGPGDTATATDHYVVVRVSASTVAKGHHEVKDRCTEIRNTLTAADLRAERLTGQRLKAVLNQLYFRKAKVSQGGYVVAQGRKPVRRMTYVSEYPEQMSLGWIADVLNAESPGLVDVVQVVEPVSDRQRDWMDRILARTDAELSASWKPFRQAGLQRQKQDLEDLIEADASGEPLVNYGVYFVARGENRVEAEETLETVQSVLNRSGVDTGEPGLYFNRGVKSVSAFHRDRLKKKEIVPGSSAAAGFAFAAYDTVEPGGIVVGEDHRNNMPVVLDRFSWEAGHTAVMGKIGSGKTYWTGLTLVRSVQEYDDLEIYVIDPKKRDYGGIVEALKGETVVIDNGLSRSRSSNITRYTVQDPSRDNTARLAETVRHVYREASKTDSKSLVVIDEVHRIITRADEIYRDGLQAVSTLVRESRDKDIAATLVTQNADEFVRSTEGENILRNIDCNLFFRQRDVDSEVTDFFHLSEKESSELRKLRSGTKLPFSEALVRGPVNTRLRIESTRPEHTLFENGIEGLRSGGNNNRVQPSNTPGQASSGVETDGGHQSKDTETNTSDSDSERYGLAEVFNLTFAGPLGLFEYVLYPTFFAALLLSFVTGLQPFHPIGPFTPKDSVGLDAALSVVSAEILWVLGLSLYRWMTQP
ncbi:hypothetical protein ACFR99_01565 [Haloarchaeobius amylolyticus]|uniref:Uncharacterized protein n=1 Tax=Haloarchaeobius amylolyticus TaxID=1198296 RepID=A0ABD6BDL9_9EURY